MKFTAKNLSVKIGTANILNGINFSLKTGDTLVISGVNGSGKTTLLKSIMKHFSVNLIGDILVDNTNISRFDTYKIAKLGIYYIPQYSLELNGVSTITFLKTINKSSNNLPFPELFKKIDNFIKKMDLPDEILNRDLNVGFSGGQKKKIELLQAQIFDPKILLIDEIDSGVDTDSLKKIANYINAIKKNTIILIISHNYTFLKMIKPTKALLLSKGAVAAIGGAKLLAEIERKGYEKFIKNNTSTKTTCQLHKK